MADQESDKDRKTEPATSKRRQELRSKGSVAKSQDLTTAIMLSAGIVLLMFFGGLVVKSLMEFNILMFSSKALGDLGRHEAVDVIYAAAAKCFPPIAIMSSILFVIGLITNYSQVGVQITTKAIAPNLEKLNPISGMKKLFNVKALVRAGMSMLKSAIILGVTYSAVKGDLNSIANLDKTDIGVVVGFLGMFVFKTVVAICASLLVIGIIDFFYQRWKFERDIKMTKEEVKDEHKNQDGDPAVKAEIRKKRRELGLRRMMADVPKATVVVTNPTHYAVALQYKEKDDAAPKVLAKGRDRVALKIREIAREHDVPIVENPPLAQNLYKGAEVGQEIPTKLYRAVAELLSYVYRLRGKL